MNHDSNNPNTAGIKIDLPNSSNKGFDIKAGIIDNTPIPNNIESKNIKKSKKFNEIVFDRKHRLNFWEWFVYGGIIVFIGMCLMCVGFIQTNYFLSFLFILLGILCLNWSYTMLFYKNQDRFYVTKSGIGFERRKWFRIQKRFFKFGEVSIFFGYIGSTDGGSGDIFIIYPFNKLRIKRLFFLPKDYIKITTYPSASMQDILHLVTFIRQKTKEALESKEIRITDFELQEKIKSYIKDKDI